MTTIILILMHAPFMLVALGIVWILEKGTEKVEQLFTTKKGQ